MFTQYFSDIISLLKSIVYSNNPLTVTKAIRFSTDQDFNFSEMGNKKKGIRSVSFRNIGNYTLIVQDIYEPIKPGEVFILSHHLCSNKSFEVKFENNPSPNGSQPIPANPVKDVVLRYNVDLD